MERDDVIKALERCTSNSSYCGSCPYDHDFGCKHNLLKDCLSVIRELDELIDDLQRDTIPKLKLGLERANAMGVDADKRIAELTKENARLRAHVLGQVQEALAAEYDYIETQKKHALDADAWYGLDAELAGLDRAMFIIDTLMEQYAEGSEQ